MDYVHYYIVWSNAESSGNSATLTSFRYSLVVGISSFNYTSIDATYMDAMHYDKAAQSFLEE